MTCTEFVKAYNELTSEDEKEKFIQQRLDDLIDNENYQKEIGKDICGSFKDFINPNTNIVSNSSKAASGAYFFAPLHMDDTDIYGEFLNYLSYYNNNGLGEPAIIKTLQSYIYKYFGFDNTNEVNNWKRIQLYDGANKYMPLKEIRGKQIAACSERSAFAQNLLKFVGIDSELIYGELDNDSHAYIIFNSSDGKNRILYDPMNPVPLKKGNTTTFYPAVSSISDEDYNKLKNGDSINPDFSLSNIFASDSTYTDESKHSYTCDDIKYKKDDNKERQADLNMMFSDEENSVQKDSSYVK